MNLAARSNYMPSRLRTRMEKYKSLWNAQSFIWVLPRTIHNRFLHNARLYPHLSCHSLPELCSLTHHPSPIASRCSCPRNQVPSLAFCISHQSNLLEHAQDGRLDAELECVHCGVQPGRRLGQLFHASHPPINPQCRVHPNFPSFDLSSTDPGHYRPRSRRDLLRRL